MMLSLYIRTWWMIKYFVKPYLNKLDELCLAIKTLVF